MIKNRSVLILKYFNWTWNQIKINILNPIFDYIIFLLEKIYTIQKIILFIVDEIYNYFYKTLIYLKIKDI